MPRQKPDEVKEELEDQKAIEGGEETLSGTTPNPEVDDDVDELTPKDEEPEHVHMNAEKIEPTVEDPFEKVSDKDIK